MNNQNSDSVNNYGGSSNQPGGSMPISNNSNVSGNNNHTSGNKSPYNRQNNNTQNNKLHNRILFIAVAVIFAFLIIAAGVGMYFVLNPSRYQGKDNSEQTSSASQGDDDNSAANGNDDSSKGDSKGDNELEITLPEKEIDKANWEDNRSYISSSKYPFKLPADAPFDFSQMEKLYQDSMTRYNVKYKTSVTQQDQFAEDMKPYVMLYLASSEYIMQQYGNSFNGGSADLQARKNLQVRVFEKCSDIGAGLSEADCADVKMVGSASPFTLETRFYVNRDHPDFHTDFIIITGMHESVHLLQYTYEIGIPGSVIPEWYKESMAEGLAYNTNHKKQLYPELFDNYSYPSKFEDLQEMYNENDDTVGNLDNLLRAYAIGGEFFEYLNRQVSLSQYLTLIPKKSSAFDNEFGEHFEMLFGKTEEEMYQEFLNSR